MDNVNGESKKKKEAGLHFVVIGKEAGGSFFAKL